MTLFEIRYPPPPHTHLLNERGKYGKTIYAKGYTCGANT
jgi:hypothetical protein